jgi:tetratricopeptide (TPR) repeat protein
VHDEAEAVVGRGIHHRMAGMLLVGCVMTSVAQNASKQQEDREFQSAVTAYNAGDLQKAATELEHLLPSVPNHFEVEELLGEVYAGMPQDAKAVEHLELAVKLKPESEPARTNLAASLARLGRTAEAGAQFQKALALAPADYSANHNLGEFYVQQGKISEARPYLEKAQNAKPTAYDNGYDLATADLITEQYAKAKTVVQALLVLRDTAELHNLFGQIDEKSGEYVAAEKQLEIAAHMDPSEENLFSWGSELMLHRTYEPAIDIFRVGEKKYPDSARVKIGLGIALYARGLYEDAVKELLTASDLSPADARCYYFLSKASSSSPAQADEVIRRFQRYSQSDPKNAMAQYYYAMSLWKGKASEASSNDTKRIETLLQSATALDDTMTDAHFQLGNLYADQHEYERSILEYARAVALNPKLADAHYRLGTDYMRMGQKDKAQAEFAVYQKLRSEHMAESDREGLAVQQFVYHSLAEGQSKP